MNQRYRFDIVCSLVIFVVALGLYIRTAAPDMIYAGGVSVDSAEIQRTTYHLGIIHSTSYPLYTVLAFLAARLGEALGQSPYTWVTYFSALCSALSLVVMFHTARHITKLLPALAVTLLLMVTNSIWFMSTITEVQGLQALIVAGFLWALLYYHQHPTQHKALYLAALCLGLGLANHRLIVLVVPALAFTWLIHFRQWKPHQLVGLVVCAALPLLSYQYIYLRAADPFVVYSARPLWIPQPISPDDATNLIRGTFAGSGTSLETNFEFNVDEVVNRAGTVAARLQQDWSLLLITAAIVGIGAQIYLNWRIGLALVLCAAPIVPFLLVWKVDVKPLLYQFTLWFPLALGLAALASFEPLRQKKDLPHSYSARGEKILSTLRILVSGLLVFAAWQQFSGNLPSRDQSQDRRARNFAHAVDALPHNALFVSVQWAPDIFITLDTLERSGRRDITIMNTDDWWAVVERIYNTELAVYVGEAWRSRIGLYEGATWLQQEHGVAFSGTHSEFLLQARPIADPRLQTEADAARIVNHPLNDEISLYSYQLEQSERGWQVTLYWQAQNVPTASYGVYTHLRYYGTMCQWDSRVGLLAQDDANAPVSGAYPTNLWSVGQIIKDTYFIPTPAEALDNDHTAFAFGMTQPTGERLNELCLPIRG